MRTDHYATALVDLLESGMNPNDAFRGLDRVLVRRGHTRLKTSILRRAHILLAKRHDAHAATVRLAHERDEGAYKTAIAKLCERLGVEAKPTVAIDDTLIGGFRFETRNHVIDRSHKRTLLELYQNIIKH